MSIQKLFLSHYNRDAGEVSELAAELRLRGIVPWVDKDGGFQVADECPYEARRAIREDCFGLLLYATRQAFSRSFIRDVEIDEAVKVKCSNTAFDLFAVPRRISFSNLSRYSLDAFGVDLSPYHTVRIPPNADVAAYSARVGNLVLNKVVRRAAAGLCRGTIPIQFSTRELMPDAPEDALRIDATSLFGPVLLGAGKWERLLVALRDVKASVAGIHGRPRLRVSGSKHLSAAFLFGRVFAPFPLYICQTPYEMWASDVPPVYSAPLSVAIDSGDPDDGRLFVEVASGDKNVSAGVDAFLGMQGGSKPARLKLRPAGAALRVDNALCRAMVDQTRIQMDIALRAAPGSEIHLFVAAPQSYMMMLGASLTGVPPVHLYEWNAAAAAYSYCFRLPGGVL